MRNIIAVALVASTLMATAAEARDGCGPYGHRNPWGRCVPNRGPVAVGPAFVIGRFYVGRGYWDGHRWWQNWDGHHYWQNGDHRWDHRDHWDRRHNDGWRR